MENKDKLLLCKKCLSIPLIDINPTTHKIISVCSYNHEIIEKSIDLYIKEEINQEIKCNKCNLKSKNNYFYCKNCDVLFCSNCANQHKISNSHILIKDMDINFVCSTHPNNKKNYICKTCNMLICNNCVSDNLHYRHNIKDMDEFMKEDEINELNNEIKTELISNIKKENQQIEKINDILHKQLNEITQNKINENLLNKKLLNNLEAFPYDCISIKNIKNLIETRKISEGNYFESIANIKAVISNYLSDKKDKEQAILIKKSNLKHIFFLIVGLLAVIFIQHFFVDYIYPNKNEKNVPINKKIILNENSNLMKLTEIIENENQMNKISKNIILILSNIIEKNNFLFNNDNNNFAISLNYKLLYKGSRDGDKIEAFKKRCFEKYNLLLIIQTNNDNKFGLFTFNGYSENRTMNNDKNSILFKIDKNRNDIKFYEYSSNYYDPNKYYYPLIDNFRNDTNKNYIVFIPDNFFEINNYGFVSNKGKIYNTTNDYELNDGNKTFTVKEIEVFQISIKNDNTK